MATQSHQILSADDRPEPRIAGCSGIGCLSTTENAPIPAGNGHPAHE